MAAIRARQHFADLADGMAGSERRVGRVEDRQGSRRIPLVNEPFDRDARVDADQIGPRSSRMTAGLSSGGVASQDLGGVIERIQSETATRPSTS